MSLLSNYFNVNVGYFWLNRATVTLDRQSQEKAQTILEQVVGRDSRLDNTAWRALGYVYLLQNDESQALAAWANVGGDVNMVRRMRQWALVYARQGNRQLARQWYERAIALDATTADNWYFAARFFEEERDITTAGDYYQKGFATGQFHEVGASDLALRLGLLAFVGEQWVESDYWFGQALSAADFRLADRAWEAYYTRGESWRLRGDLAAAAPDYQWVVEHNPNHYWAHIRLAQVYWLVKVDLDRAESLLLQAIDINQDSKWAYKILGDLYREQQRPEAAGEMYRQALIRDPEDQMIQRALQGLEQDGN